MDPSPTAAENGERSSWSGVPVAAVLCICLALFLFAVITLLCIRKLLQRRGIYGPNLSCSCCDRCCEGGGGGCGWCSCDVCISVAERLDCKTPDSQACLDSVCPSKQACSAWCGQLWSCYACHVIREQCQLMSCAALCPGCTACECPDFQCCGHCCHCKFKAPECTHINCLFCDLDCENTDQ